MIGGKTFQQWRAKRRSHGYAHGLSEDVTGDVAIATGKHFACGHAEVNREYGGRSSGVIFGKGGSF